MQTFCKHCKTLMGYGIALKNTVVGSVDFNDTDSVCTMCYSGTSTLIRVLKCPKCGWSLTY